MWKWHRQAVKLISATPHLFMHIINYFLTVFYKWTKMLQAAVYMQSGLTSCYLLLKRISGLV